MAPKAKANKASKGMKENIRVYDRSKIKSVNKVTVSSRRALADKTNSASDDNESLVVPKKFTKEVLLVNEKQAITEESKGRPHRNRRVPSRYIENHILKSLSNCTEGPPVTTISDKSNTRKDCSNPEPMFKTPQKDLENSLITNRPRRICRLPSKFDGNLISPNKHAHVQPCHTSTPLSINNKDSRIKQRNADIEVSPQTKLPESSGVTKGSRHNKVRQKSSQKPIKKLNGLKNKNNSLKDKTNVSSIRRQGSDLHTENTSHNISKSQNNATGPKYRDKRSNRRILNNSNSFKVLENKNSKDADVYEFTYDPNEEPLPQKKKRKRVNKRKPAQPKVVIWKNNYDKKLSKVLAGLKVIVSQKSQPDGKDDITDVKLNINNNINHVNKISENELATPNIVKSATGKSIQQNDTETANNKMTINNNPSHLIGTSIQIDDIAADFNALDYQDDINYSPVNSPIHPTTPVHHNAENNRDSSPVRSTALNNDPLNLRDELNLDFFDEPPVASSSINVSTRSVKHPLASPWRTDFDNLPIKWHVNTYMKQNMTPAIESSYINFDDSNRKKHVYTNLVAQTNENLPEIIENRLKQMSIISYIKEVVEKSAIKKKRVRSVTPVHHNDSIFDDVTNDSVNISVNASNKTPRKLVTPRKDNLNSSTTPNKSTSKENISDSSKNSSKGRKASKELRKRKNDRDSCDVPTKTPRKNKNNVDTFFGFDESDDLEIENAPLNKNINRNRIRALRPRSRAVLREINQQAGPTRGILPIAAKTKLILDSEAVNQVNDKMISENDAPMFPEKDNAENNLETTNIHAKGTEDVINEDSQSVHLFEDLELIHHLKKNRKSYGKPKKIAFHNNISDSDVQDSDNIRTELSEHEDDFNDLTFQMPEVRTKKRTKKKKTVTKKQLMSKKEAEEAEAWAAGFNSMCEDVDQFPLVIE